MKNRRHDAILEIIGENIVATQEMLIELLAERGINTTQATLSRDIQQLCLVKQRDENASSCRRCGEEYFRGRRYRCRSRPEYDSAEMPRRYGSGYVRRHRFSQA